MEQQIRNHLKLLGCTSPSQISIAFQVYLELLDVKLMHDINILYCDKMKIPYLTARNSKRGSPKIFVPYSTTETITLKYVEKLQNALCEDSSVKFVTLACADSDSTIVFYSFQEGFLNLQNTNCFSRQKTREERKKYFEREINKNRNSLLVDAYKNSVIDE